MKGQLPGVHVTLLARGVGGKLAPLIPGLDDWIVLKERKPNLAAWLKLIRGRFDVVLDLSANDRSEFATLLARAKTRVTFKKWQRLGRRGRLYNAVCPGGIKENYMADFFLRILEPIGLEPRWVPAALKLSAERSAIEPQIDHLKRGGRRLAVIHPGTTEAKKYWTAEGWAAVIDHLKRQQRCSVLISRGNDPVEIEHLERIRSLAETTIDADEFISLPDLVTALHHCDIALGVDTGAMHIASLAEKPQVVLFGRSNWIQWRPRHEKARVLRPDEGDIVSVIPIPAAIGAIDELFPTTHNLNPAQIPG